MLAHYQDTVDPIDRRLKIAERTLQTRSASVAGDGVSIRTTAGDVEALDQFMAAITDKKLLEERPLDDDGNKLEERSFQK